MHNNIGVTLYLFVYGLEELEHFSMSPYTVDSNWPFKLNCQIKLSHKNL